ncbi:hypothetical protein Pfo_014098 [Paulownia fortunei]|nr:hypothetical protein Pfo_014098 [Paulownia fortunei]
MRMGLSTSTLRIDRPMARMPPTRPYLFWVPPRSSLLKFCLNPHPKTKEQRNKKGFCVYVYVYIYIYIFNKRISRFTSIDLFVSFLLDAVNLKSNSSNPHWQDFWVVLK